MSATEGHSAGAQRKNQEPEPVRTKADPNVPRTNANVPVADKDATNKQAYSFMLERNTEMQGITSPVTDFGTI